MRLGTRGSALALAQAQRVADLLGGAELVTTAVLPSSGSSGDKSRWVRGLEEALLAGTIDLAVHSAKDVPEELPEGLALLGAPARVSAEDVLCGASSLDALAPSSRIGTASPRRGAQLRAARDDLEVVKIAGNVDTRLRMLGDPALALDAIVLARAGLVRLRREDAVDAVLDPKRFVPAPGQGAVALEGRAGDDRAREAARAITDERTLRCLRAERALARALGSSCNTPIGAHASLEPTGGLHVHAWLGLPDGSAWLADHLAGGAGDPEALGRSLAARMLAAGAAELLREAEEMARAAA